MDNSRRSFLKTATLLAGVAAVPVSFLSREAFAAKAAKASMQYQDTPKGDAYCATCMQFIPGKSAKAKGECKVVEGSINPHGWCSAYAA